MTTRPWMPLYVADYRADTAHLSAAQHGAYLLLIMHYWQTGSLPADDEPLARIACMKPAEWRKARPTIAAFFTPEWRHKRIDEELARATEISSKRRASAQQRHCKSDANAEQLDTHARATSPSPSQQKDKTADAASTDYVFNGGIIRLSKKHFDNWTEAYPKIDLRAELTARDAWLGSDRATDNDRKSWFISTSKYLANRNQEAKTQIAVRREPERAPGAIAEIL